MKIHTLAELVESRPYLVEMVESAIRIRARAYAPNSGFKVGSTIRVNTYPGWPEQTRFLFPGCNVENVIQLATHAEVAAIAAMIGILGDNPKPVIATVVVALVPKSEDKPALPCGLCLQWIAEFGTPGTEIFGVRLAPDGKEVLGVQCSSLGAELPNAFVV